MLYELILVSPQVLDTATGEAHRIVAMYLTEDHAMRRLREAVARVEAQIRGPIRKVLPANEERAAGVEIRSKDPLIGTVLVATIHARTPEQYAARFLQEA